MRASAADIAKASAGNVSRGVNTAAFGARPEVPTDLALILAAVEGAGYGPAVLEFKFLEGRKYAFDCAWPSVLVAFEREGGAFVRVACRCGVKQTRFVSRHNDRDGMESDCEKYNAGAALGWAIVRGTPPMLSDGRALAALLATLERRTRGG